MANLTDEQKKRMKKNMAMIQPPALGMKSMARKMGSNMMKSIFKKGKKKTPRKKTESFSLPGQKKRVKITREYAESRPEIEITKHKYQFKNGRWTYKR